MEYMDFELPVGAIVGNGDKQRRIATMVEARIAVASEDEAPLVARWNGYDHGNHEFRAWNGRLVGREIPANDVAEAFDAGWDMPSLRSRGRLRSYPYFAWGGEIPSEMDGAMSRSASVHPQLERNARLAVARIEGSVVVGGRVWVPTNGPRVSLQKYADDTIGVFPDGPCYRGGFRDPNKNYSAPWTALDTGSIVGALRASRGIAGCRDLTPALEVISWNGWSREAIEQDSDEMVLDYLVHAIISWRMGVKLSNASPELIEAIAAVRDARRQGSATNSFIAGVVADEPVLERGADEFGDRFAAVTRWFDLAHEKWGTVKDAMAYLALFRVDIDRIAARNAALYRSLEGFSV